MPEFWADWRHQHGIFQLESQTLLLRDSAGTRCKAAVFAGLVHCWPWHSKKKIRRHWVANSIIQFGQFSHSSVIHVTVIFSLICDTCNYYFLNTQGSSPSPCDKIVSSTKYNYCTCTLCRYTYTFKLEISSLLSFLTWKFKAENLKVIQKENVRTDR